ncbi:MAG: DUF2442 domain-containing protein [Verrucomicrobia bacterium]|nr:DUF2442 domain-containing protein [Verrucomicrobiota bacterium]
MIRQAGEKEGRFHQAASRFLALAPVVEQVEIKGNHLTFGLSDGNRVAVHLLLYPKLLDASELQRKSWNLIAGGKGVRWADIDENISVTGLLALQKVRRRVDTLDV